MDLPIPPSPEMLKSIGKRLPRHKQARPEVKRSKSKPATWVAEWHVYVIGADGGKKRKHRTGVFGLCARVSKGEAQAACDEQVRRETMQDAKPSGDMTLQAFWERIYRPVRSRMWAKNGYASLESCWRNLVEPYLGAVPLTELAKHQIQMHLIALADKGYGKQSLQHARFLLNNLCEEAVDNRFIPANPCHKVKLPQCKDPEETRALSLEEVQRLLSGLSGRDRLMFRVLILCGLRISELLALEWADIQDGRMRVDESSLYGVASKTKNRKIRIVPIASGLRAELDMWRESSTSHLVFQRDGGGMYGRYHREIRSLLERAKKIIPDVTFHMCRRTFSTLYEGDLKDLQNMLGHAKIDMTMEHYKKGIMDRAQIGVDELERKLQ